MNEQATEVQEVPMQEVPVASTEVDMESKIPGLEVTYQMAKELDWSDPMITAMQRAKSEYPNVHVVECASQWYVIRPLNRREYKIMVQDHAGTVQDKVNNGDGSSPQAIQANLNMMNEETIAVKGTVYPRLDMDVIRSKEAGLATTLHDAILSASGYQSQPVALKI